MIAAIYARKSTEQNGVGDEDKSITRQIEHAKAYAERNGWQVREVFEDDGISGAEFVNRPGLARLMNALKPRPRFQVLVMSEESRLGREQIETAYIVKQIIDAGVQIFFYLEDRERTLGNPTDKLLLAVSGFASEVERDKARQRTYDALLRKARALHVAGGKVYGYDNVRGDNGAVTRIINSEQSAVVRRIFELYAEGKGITKIAKLFNAEGVASPSRENAHGWAPTAIREMLYRDLYRGVVVWGRTQRVDRAGATNKKQARPEKDWTRVEAPDLRIIPEGLWQRTRVRLEANHEAYARSHEGRLLGRPARIDFESNYLLTGFLACAVCGASVTAATRQRNHRMVPVYRCTYNWKRGPKVCTHDSLVPIQVLDTGVLDALAGIMDERVIERAIQKALAKLHGGSEGIAERRSRIERELTEVATRERNLTDAVARGGDSLDALVTALKTEQQRRKLLEAQRAELEGAERLVGVARSELRDQVRGVLANVRGLLGETTRRARQALRRLDTRFTVEPVTLPGGRRGVRFVGTGSYRKLFSQILPLGEAGVSVKRAEVPAPVGGTPARLMVVPPG